MSRPAVLWLWVALVVLWETVAAAQGCAVSRSAAAVPNQDPPAQYWTAMGAAVQAFDKADYDAARAAFLRAHRAFPGASALRGLGLVAFERHAYREAIDCLQAALSSPNQPLSAATSAATVALLDRAGQFVGSYRLRLDRRPVGVSLAIDGISAPWDGEAPILLLPGHHQLRLQAPGYHEWTERLLVVAGEQATFEVRMKPATAQLGSDPPPGSPTGNQAAALADKPNPRRRTTSPAQDGLRLRAGLLLGARGRFELSSGGDREDQRLAPAFGGVVVVEWPVLSLLTVGGGLSFTSWTSEYFQRRDVGRHWLVEVPIQVSLRHAWVGTAMGALEIYLGPTLGPSLNRFSSDLTRLSQQSYSGGLGYHLGLRAGVHWFFARRLGVNMEVGYLTRTFGHRATSNQQDSSAAHLKIRTAQLVALLSAQMCL